jgi:pimeloyl-ACP methyl ester carboxylesterase
MNQVHQTTQPGIAEHAMLAGDIYKDREDRGYSTNGWKATGKLIDNTDLTSRNGLQMQIYTNQQYANHVVIAIAGTNDRADFDDDIAFVTGALEGQAKQVLEYAAKMIDAANKAIRRDKLITTTFSTTGHSLGGGLAQLVAYTFNINGMALDAPGAQAIANNQDYGEYIEKLKQQYPDAFSNVAEPAVGENFVNINERGSVIPLFGQHLGQEIAINAVPNELPSGPWWEPQIRNIWWQTGKLVLKAGRYVAEQHQAAAQIDYLVQRYGPGRRPLTSAEIIAIRAHGSLQEHAEIKRVTQAAQHTITEAQQQASQTEAAITQQVNQAQAAA